MRILWSLAVLGLAASFPVAAGEFNPESVDLQTPVAPAFNILGVSPESIARPTTPRALAVDVLSGVFPTSASAAQTLALQVAPYWLMDHPDLTWNKLVDGSCTDSVVQNLTVSVATSPKTDLRSDEPGGAGIGLRSMCFVRLGTSEISEAKKKLDRLHLAYVGALQELPDVKASLKPLETKQRHDLAEALGRLGTVAVLLAQAQGEKAKVGNKLDPLSKDRLDAQVGALEEAKAEALKDRDNAEKQLDLDDPTCSEVAAKVVAAKEATTEESVAKEAAKGGGAKEQVAFKEATAAKEAALKAADKARNDAKEMMGSKVPVCELTVQRVEAERLQKILDDEAALSKQAAKVEALLPRQGIAFDLAAAMAVALPEGERASVLRTGAWGTVSWRPVVSKGSQFELSGLGRYLTYGPEGAMTQYFDLGGRMTFQTASVVVALEGVRRLVIDTDTARTDSWRAVMTTEIPVNDDLKIGFTFGKDFRSDLTDFEPLIAVLGVKLQLGKKPN